MIKDQRVTVADLLAEKGRRVMTELNIETGDELAAAAAAGIDMVTIREDRWSPDLRVRAPNIFVISGLLYGRHATTDDYLRAAFAAITSGADAVYCAASLQTIRRLADEGIPVVGHVGLVPSKRTWTGGWRAVGKTAQSAMAVLQATLALEEAGAFAVEMELVPTDVAAFITLRTRMLVLSMGSGPRCDAQYLFARDVLGAHDGHYPRHARRYHDFLAEYRRLQAERTVAFGAFRKDVEAGAFPESHNSLTIPEAEWLAFLAEAGSATPPRR